MTGFSGLPFSIRHWQLAANLSCLESVGHHLIGALEVIPVIGGIVAVAEKVVCAVQGVFKGYFNKEGQSVNLGDDPFLNVSVIKPQKDELDISYRNRKYLKDNIENVSDELFQEIQDMVQSFDLQDGVKFLTASWRGSYISIDDAFEKMKKNTQKAILEHQKKSDTIYANFDQIEAFITLDDKSCAEDLSLFAFYCEAQGKREHMEDATFFEQTEDSVIIGLLDGHGGSFVSKYIASKFPQRFYETLERLKGNIHQAFEVVFENLQLEIAMTREWSHMGSTIVVSYIDKKKQLIYTATLGDSEANIYRVIDDTIKSIPLSCVRDWSSKKDSLRASSALGKHHIAKDWLNHPDPKSLRFPLRSFGVNVSRAFGDCGLVGLNKQSAIIQKPKITVNRLMQNDKLILACDGLKDFALEEDIASLVETTSIEMLPQKLVQFALNDCRSSDNVSVIAVEIQ